MGSIYKITNTVNGKAYIGQTIHDAVKDRISRHLNGQSGGNRLVKHAIKKYGKDAFTYEILHDGIIPQFLNDLEIEAIEKFNTIAPHGYNLDTGGNSVGSPSEETRRKISEANTGIPAWNKGKTQGPLSEETRRKISEAQTGEKHHFFGKTLSEEIRRKISEANKGKRHTPEARRKMSESRKGKKHSEEHRRKISEANKGKKHMPESRKKMSEAQKRRKRQPHSEETRRKMSEAQKHPMHELSKEFYFSLPADMSLTEKRKSVREFSGIHRDTIRRWTLKWENEKTKSPPTSQD